MKLDILYEIIYVRVKLELAQPEPAAPAQAQYLSWSAYLALQLGELVFAAAA